MNAEAGVLAAAQVVAMVALSPLLVGVMRQVRARLEGRVGAGVLQPWRDLRKLLAKEPLQAQGQLGRVGGRPDGADRLEPAGLRARSAGGHASRSPAVPSDLFVVVSVLLIGTVALALVGLDAGTAFGGMGSSRHMTIAALVEPTVLVSVYALSIPVGSSELSQIVRGPTRRSGQRRVAGQPAGPARAGGRGGRRDRQAPRRQPLHPPRADDGPRGHGAGELGP